MCLFHSLTLLFSFQLPFSIFPPYLPLMKGSQGGYWATEGPSGHKACWESEHLALNSQWNSAVKWNRLNHAVKQVFTGLHYNVIFSLLLSFSILLLSVSQRKSWFLQADDIWSAGGGGVQLDDPVHIARLGTLYPAENVSNAGEMWRPIKPISCFIRLER